jgi:anthranilate/para-aminobenzoate synthase component II
MDEIKDWQGLVNKPVLSSDESQIGIVTEIQPLHIIISSGPVTPNKYNIPKKLVNKFENGTVSLNVNKKYVEENCEFE